MQSFIGILLAVVLPLNLYACNEILRSELSNAQKFRLIQCVHRWSFILATLLIGASLLLHFASAN